WGWGGGKGCVAGLMGAYDLGADGGTKRRVRPCRARDDGAVDGDCNPALTGVDRLFLEQDRQRRDGQRLVLPVNPDVRFNGGLRHCGFSLFRRGGEGPQTPDSRGGDRGPGEPGGHEAGEGGRSEWGGREFVSGGA